MSEDEIEEMRACPTDDIRHDLAMMMASVQRGFVLSFYQEYIEIYTNELIRRGAKIPTQCRYEYSPYARFKEKLLFDLEEE